MGLHNDNLNLEKKNENYQAPDAIAYTLTLEGKILNGSMGNGGFLDE